MIKIVILGAGSIGCWLGGYLASGGANVVLIGRGRYAQSVADNGLRLTHFEREEVYLPKIEFVTDPAALIGADIVALCVKSQDTKSAAKQIAKYAPKACVVSFQNGIRNPETLREALPQAQVVAAIVPFNVTPTEAGAFHCGTAGSLVVGRDPRVEPLVTAFRISGQEVRLSDEIIGDQWAKMIVNLNNGLNTLSGGTLREGLMQRDYRRALAICVQEALSVAHASDVNVGTFNGRAPSALVKTLRLPNWAYGLVMQLIVKIDAKARSSMLDDLEMGRVPEIDYLQGEIVRQAEKVDQSAPHNAAVLSAVLKSFSTGESPRLNGSEILELLNRDI